MTLHSIAEGSYSRIDTMMQFFKSVVIPEQKEITARVRDKGGEAVALENDRLLKELLDLYRGTDGAVESSGLRGRRDGVPHWATRCAQISRWSRSSRAWATKR